MYEGTTKFAERQEAEAQSEALSKRLGQFIAPLMKELHAYIDIRLLRTLRDLLLVIVMHRNRQQGLLLSELGGWLMGDDRAPAGVKRIASLLHSRRWNSHLIEGYLWAQGQARVEALKQDGEEVYAIWDESVMEKPESLQAERLCAVRSSKAARLKRIKPGFYNPPGGRPVFVPGFNWLQVLVTGKQGMAQLAHMCWWTTRGAASSDKRSEERQVLEQVAQRWGRSVVHVWDRGFASHPWLAQVFTQQVRFILRWRSDYRLLNTKGELKAAYKHSLGKPAWATKPIRYKGGLQRQTSVLAVPVWLEEQPDIPLWLVIARSGSGRQPWYLLTNDPIETVSEAWRIVFAYTLRWQIEMAIRFDKSELAIECPRLLTWDSRQKFLLLVSLVYSFLISLLAPELALFRDWLFRCFCHRTGKWSRETPAPLYRLRLACSKLWLFFRPPCLPRLLISG
jgi:hypothetical protein